MKAVKMRIVVLVVSALIVRVCGREVDLTDVEIIRKPCADGLMECVPINLCSNQTDFSDGRHELNVRFTFNDESDEECHYLEVCCDPENIISSHLGSSTIITNFKNTALESCEQQCRVDHHMSEDYKISCGFLNKNGVGVQQTIDPNVTQFGEFPWMMALMEEKNFKFEYICGGSLIHPSVVLSAAHCVAGKEASSLKVRAGEWDTQTTKEPFPHSDHEVEKTILHKNYAPTTLFNDVALLVLKTSVKLSSHINTICLPPQNFKFDKTNCFGTGWGADNWESAGKYRANLKKVELNAVGLKDCQDRLRTTNLGSLFKIHTSFMCAGGEKNVDLCVGDGGSPLVCPITKAENYYHQAGVTSWGIKCGQEGIPGIYANVAKFRDFIDREMIDLGFGTRSYSF